MACINPNSPEFKEALARLGNPLLAEIEVDKVSTRLKPGVNEFYNAIPELVAIGTAEQYSQYLNTVFPNSTVKDVVYHGSKAAVKMYDGKIIDSRFIMSEPDSKGFQRPIKTLTEEEFNNLPDAKFEKFKKREHDYGGLDTFLGTGNYFTTSVEQAKKYAKTNLYTAIIDVRNPYTEGKGYGSTRGGKGSKDLIKQGYDSVTEKIGDGQEYNVFEPEQIHILGSKKDIEGFKNFVRPEAKVEVENPIYDNKVLRKVNTFLERINVDVRKVKEILVNGKKADANAVADFTRRLIEYTEGNEAALTEEALHFAVEILEQTNPELFNQMLNKIGSYPVYKGIFNTYALNPEYQTKEGKPDIRKIKKEAIARQMQTVLLESTEDNTIPQKESLMEWWDSVLQWFKSLFSKPGFNPFEEGVAKIFDEELGTAETYVGEGVMFSLKQDAATEGIRKQTELYNKLKTTRATKNPTGEGYVLDGKLILSRVSDLVKKFYKSIFDDGEIGKSEYQKAVDDIKKKYGTAAHADIENIVDELIDEDGYLRLSEKENKKYIPKTSDVIYQSLKLYMAQKLASYPEGTRFLTETVVYDNKNMAGTIDFIAITKEGKVSILDWKTMDLDPNKTEDVPWYKKRAFRIQIAAYKKMLQDAYGVKPSDFVETQAVPILAKYTYIKAADGKYYPQLNRLIVGNVNVKAETRDYLLPVALEQQSSGDPTLDKIMNKLYGLRETLETRKATTAEERYIKADQLNQIEKAIRHLQMKQSVIPLLDQAEGYLEELQRLVDVYNNTIKGKNIDTVSRDEVKAFAIKINRAFDEVSLYTQLEQELSSFFEGKLTDEQKQVYKKLTDVATEARRMEGSIKNVNIAFGEQIANSVGFKDIIAPEVQISMNKRLFIETSKIQQRILQVLFKKRREAQNKMDYKTSEENEELLNIKKSYDEWAKGKGLGPKNYFDILVKKGSNVLIDQFKGEFYTQLKEALAKKDFDWLDKNVDLDKYAEELAKKKEEKIAYVNSKYYYGTKEQAREKRKRDLQNIEKDYSLTSVDSDGWFKHYYIIRNSPNIQKWESEEWKALNAKENAPAKKLYDWIQKTNEKASNVGYLPDRTAKSKRVFLPFVAKSLASSITFGGKLNFMEEFFRQITIDENTVGYGKIDKLTGKLERKIPTYFTRELEGREFSTDLFTNLALYNASVNRYESLSEIEGIALSLGRVERNKGSLQTSFWGKPIFNLSAGRFDPVDNNDRNADFYDRQVATLIYDQKYVDSEQFDQLLGSVSKANIAINKFFGRKILPENLDNRQLSLVKSIDALNRYFSLTKLGFNPLSAMSNFFGGNVQSIIAAGRHFTKGDFIKSEYELTTMGLQGDYGKKVMAAIQYFQPFTDDMNRDMARKLSLALVSDNGIQDALMYLMRKGDRLVQSTIFLSYLRNQIIVNGEMMNARDYVRQQPEWATRYDNPEKLKEIEAGFEDKVEEAIKKYGLLEVAKVQDGKLVIPGIERMSEQVFNVRNLTREFTKNVLGNMTPEQVMGIQQNVIGRSFMVFKNWIPALIDVRYGQMKYNAATDAYEWGRARTMARFLAVNGLGSLFRLRDVVNGAPQSIEDLNRLYEWKLQQYKEMTGQELEMTKEEFYDMVRENIRKNAKDAIIALSLLAMFIALKVAAPDDDDDDYTKNVHKFTLKAADKLIDELTFFYNPVSFQQILGGTIFPAMGTFKDFGNIINHFLTEMYGMSFDEKLEEKNHVIKYFFNVVPIAPMASAYMPLYAPELAKELGIKMATRSRMR